MVTIPGSVVVAEVNQLDAAQKFCERGNADLVVMDARVMQDRSQSLGKTSVLLDPVKLAAWAGLDMATVQMSKEALRPWQVDHSRVLTLSSREWQVFIMLGIGLSNRRIASMLCVTERTVKTHVGRVLGKLGLDSRLQAGLAAYIYVGRHATADPQRLPAGAEDRC